MAWPGGVATGCCYAGWAISSARTVYHRLEQTPLTGTANVAAASGFPFPSLFGDFGLALYADSVPGQSRTAAPQRDRFSSRNLRQLYQAIFNAGGPSSDIPLPFPITTFTLGVGIIHSDAMPAGSLDYATLVTPANSAVVHIRFARPDGGTLPSSLVPQLGILRVRS
jgi:hypothetical protein